MTSERPPARPPATPPAPADPRAAREAKLAEALRANLRRRKAPPAPRAAEGEGEDSA